MELSRSALLPVNRFVPMGVCATILMTSIKVPERVLSVYRIKSENSSLSVISAHRVTVFSSDVTVAFTKRIAFSGFSFI